MQNRLFARLGAWAMMPDDELSETLEILGERKANLTNKRLRRARTLFANALETPGGLKIQTIHSFCDKLLRLFPLEASVSPQFEVMEDRQGRLLRAEVLDELANGSDTSAFDGLAKYFGGADPDDLLKEILRNRDSVLAEVTQSGFGISDGASIALLAQQLLDESALKLLSELSQLMVLGSKTDKGHAASFEKVFGSSDYNEMLRSLEGVFLYKDSKKFGPYSAKLGKVPTAASGIPKQHPDIVEDVDNFMERVAITRKKRVALLAYQRAKALHSFSLAFLLEYDRRKNASALLDYDDLISKASSLLSTSVSAQWVLYKLDGGIDHVLIDEAQDTSPAQWNVIAKLTEEFTVGMSASSAERTVFVVGDEKQSIYSFQGADPAEFGRMRNMFSQRYQEIGESLHYQDLLFSFRSAKPILQLVDSVFDGQAGEGLQGGVKHQAINTDQPGRVDLWRFIETDPKAEEPPWYEPLDIQTSGDPRSVLAGQVAEWIDSILSGGMTLPGSSPRRSVCAGDILILVQRRGPLFRSLIKELKARNLPVAGADRLNVGKELAVRDILSLLNFVDLPEDDLSLAEAMRSPLLGLSENELFKFAYSRNGTLWQSFRNAGSDYPETLEMLWKLLNQADFLRPYELIEMILSEFHGRRKMLARLGSEVEDAIDELLSQALLYEQIEVPTLSGFLHWFDSGEVEIKREMESGANHIRIMTVHGAKGLEAPVVILPDTAKRQFRDRNQIVARTGHPPIWKVDKSEALEAQLEIQESRKVFESQERQRLLYVALTRAESWLVICGAGDAGSEGESWYSLVRSGLEKTNAVDCDDPLLGSVKTLELNWAAEQRKPSPKPICTKPELPDWVATPAPSARRQDQLLSPSKIEGAKALPSESSDTSEEARLRKGRQVHVLLENLPKTEAKNWSEEGKTLLGGDLEPISEAEFSTLMEEAQAVLNCPELAFLFAENTIAEVGITASAQGFEAERLSGVIDRLVISEKRVLAIDFKTNSAVPKCPEDTPIGVLRQLAAYLVALKQVFSDRPVELAIVWTRTPELMVIPHDIVMDSIAAPATS